MCTKAGDVGTQPLKPGFLILLSKPHFSLPWATTGINPSGSVRAYPFLRLELGPGHISCQALWFISGSSHMY
jgi:hypothetical protein